MCGISGIFDPSHQLRPIGTMNQVQVHRGPDDEGYVFFDTNSHMWVAAGGTDTPEELQLPALNLIAHEDFNLALASRRLAILDLSPQGHMPMPYQNGRFWLVHNGEIYNYKELRQELGSLGYRFVSDTDTEVILAAYAEWGVDCLPRFNGMFAFALWDQGQKRLFLARDRFGIKPLYYYWDGAKMGFASELKSLIQHPSIGRRPNDKIVFDYLTLGLTDHTEETFYENILALQPGHFMTLQCSHLEMRIQRWWQAEINPCLAPRAVERQERIYEEFARLLEDAIRLRLRSDVDIGSCLSGGLDSSAIVVLANRLLQEEGSSANGGSQKTFTARNVEKEIDEYDYSHLIVEQTGAEENLIYPQPDVLWQELKQFVWQMDEPVNSTSQYAQWNVMRLASQHNVTVLLDGQGGDETLAGYMSYFIPYLNQMYQEEGMIRMARSSMELARIGGKPALNLFWQHTKHQMPWPAQRLLDLVSPPRLSQGLGGSGIQLWQLEPSFLEAHWDRRWQPDSTLGNGLADHLYRDLTTTNLPKLLRYEDRNSMAFSLETRLPFLDYRLVEMTFALPLSYRIHNGWTKWILRRSLDSVLPREITWRRTKLGFPTPEYNWLKAGVGLIRQLMDAHSRKDTLSRYIEKSELSQMANVLTDEEIVCTPGLWRLVNLGVWFDSFCGHGHENEIDSQPVSIGVYS